MLRGIVAVVGIAFVVAVVAGALWVELSDLARLQRYLDCVNELGIVGYVSLSLAYVVLAMMPVPLMPLTALGGFVMGFWVGFALLWPASIASAALTHWLGRRHLTQYTPVLLRAFKSRLFEIGSGEEPLGYRGPLIDSCRCVPSRFRMWCWGNRATGWAQVIGTALGIIPALSFALT